MQAFNGDTFTCPGKCELVINSEYLFAYDIKSIRVISPDVPANGGNSGGNGNNNGGGGGNNGGGGSGGGTVPGGGGADGFSPGDGNINPLWDMGADYDSQLNSVGNPTKEFIGFLQSESCPTSGFFHRNVVIINTSVSPSSFLFFVCTNTGAAVSGEWSPGTVYPLDTWVSYNGIAYSLTAVFPPTAASNIPPTQSESGRQLSDGYTWQFQYSSIATFLAAAPALDGLLSDANDV